MATYPANLPQPSYGSSLDEEYRVEEVTFGYGYEQGSKAGPNNTRRVGSFTYTGVTKDEAEDLREYFAGLGGVDVFEWTPPELGTELRFKSGKKFGMKYRGFNNFDCSIEVKQVFIHG